MKPISDLSPREKAVELLRWLLVLPSAMLAGLILRLIATALTPPVTAQLPRAPSEISGFRRFVLPHLLGALVAAAFVVAGAKLAPRRRSATAIVLALVWTLSTFAIHVLGHHGAGRPHLKPIAVAMVATACGAAFVWYSERSRAEES